MKEKALIYREDPCTVRLDDPAIQTLSDAKAREPMPCRYYSNRAGCSPPRFGCVQRAGLKVVRYVIKFYSEVSEQTLAMEIEEFRRNAAMPPDQLEAYIDTPEYDYRLLTDPESVLQRVTEYARKVLDLKPGEQVFRSPEEHFLVSGEKDCS